VFQGADLQISYDSDINIGSTSETSVSESILLERRSSEISVSDYTLL